MFGSITWCLLLTGCDEKTSAVPKENKTTHSNQEAKAENKTANSKQETKTVEKEAEEIQGVQITPQAQSRYTVEMRSVEGKNYSMYVFANNEKHETQLILGQEMRYIKAHIKLDYNLKTLSYIYKRHK